MAAGDRHTCPFPSSKKIPSFFPENGTNWSVTWPALLWGEWKHALSLCFISITSYIGGPSWRCKCCHYPPLEPSAVGMQALALRVSPHGWLTHFHSDVRGPPTFPKTFFPRPLPTFSEVLGLLLQMLFAFCQPHGLSEG